MSIRAAGVACNYRNTNSNIKRFFNKPKVRIGISKTWRLVCMPSAIVVECHFFHGGEPPLVGVKRVREVLDALVDLAQMVAVITTIRIR